MKSQDYNLESFLQGYYLVKNKSIFLPLVTIHDMMNIMQ